MVSKRVLGIVADDLTGALDAAAPFAARGITVRALLDESADIRREVLTISTETRDDFSDAAAKVTRALKRLERLGAANLFKKIDSTLRGDFGLEIVTVLDWMPPRAVAIICPAHPSTGRVVMHGAVVVEGEPTSLDIATRLPEPSVQLDPLALRRTSSAPRHRLMIADASNDDDLLSIVEWGRKYSGPVLFVGSGGLAGAVAAGMRPQATAKTKGGFPEVSSKKPVLVVAGSQHARTREQLASLSPDIPTLALPLASIDESGTWERLALDMHRASSEAIVLTTGEGRVLNAQGLDSRLAAVAAVVAAEGIAGLVLTGGATARAVLNRLHVAAIDLEGEVFPGMPIGQIVSGSCNGLPIITKAGGFGEPEAIDVAIAYIRAKTRRLK